MTANNAFIGACLEIDKALARITEARANHFGVDPESKRNWGEAGSAAEVARKLTEIADFIDGTTK